MIVLTLTDCPIALRGDLTKWLLEINTGVYVGRVSARVRDYLWERVVRNIKNGRATLVYTANNEQKMEFRLHHSGNEIVDFDGLKLVRKPSPARTQHLKEKRLGFSAASKMRMARRKRCNKLPMENNTSQIITNKTSFPDDYVILDIETTGLDPNKHEIIEVGALLIRRNALEAKYTALLKVYTAIPVFIQKLTGINETMLAERGRDKNEVLEELRCFIGDNVILGHNVHFDLDFLNAALSRLGMGVIENQFLDTMELYSQQFTVKNKRKKLSEIAKQCGVNVEQKHRALNDCYLLKAVYDSIRVNFETK